MGPILALIAFNTVLFVIVIRVVLINAFSRKIVDLKNDARVRKTLRMLFSIVSIMLMFGIQWLFGAFTIGEASIAFQWLFVIFSTFQGFVLFLFFVGLNKEARDEWLRVFSFGLKKAGVVTSHSSQGTRQYHTGSTSLLPNSPTSTLQKVTTSGSVVEMNEYRKKLLMAPPTIISNKETASFIESGITNPMPSNEGILLLHVYLANYKSNTPAHPPLYCSSLFLAMHVIFVYCHHFLLHTLLLPC